MRNFIIFTIIIILASIQAQPRRINAQRGKLDLRDSKVSLSILVDTSLLNYSLKRGDYILTYYTRSQDRNVYSLSSPHFEGKGIHPDSVTVCVNPASPDVFHLKYNCSKIGQYRKLDYYFLHDLLSKNKNIAVCPHCFDKSYFIHCVQFVLSE